MRHKILILDTSVLCCWLKVPGKETAGPECDRWDYDRINRLLEEESRAGTTFVLPIAALIETGNHIAQAPHQRYECALELAAHLRNASDANSPWAAFVEQSELWSAEKLRSLAEEWPQLAAANITIADATIKSVAEYYAAASVQVTILTGDAGLKAFEPAAPPLVPRRRT